MPGLAAFGQWPPLPKLIGEALVNSDGTIASKQGPAIASVARTGVGVYVVNLVAAVVGDLARVNVKATASTTAARIIDARVTSATQVTVHVFTDAAVASDDPFYVSFSK